MLPVSFRSDKEDPSLLLAHHNHWFGPCDTLQEPVKRLRKLLGLPYVDVEGFSMHPHRRLDIPTCVLNGSAEFRHKDSLCGSRIYRGGCPQRCET